MIEIVIEKIVVNRERELVEFVYSFFFGFGLNLRLLSLFGVFERLVVGLG